MTNHIFNQIDFAKYQRWISRSNGIKAELLIFDSKGKPIWGENCSKVMDLGMAILAEANFDAGIQRQEFIDNKVALYQSLNIYGNGVIGWIAVIVDYYMESDAPVNIDHLVETLEDLIAGITDEYRYKYDLNLMTDELGARYEELHLVYAVDQHVQNHKGENEQVFQSLLKSTAEHLNVDVVAFVRPAKNICHYATSLSKEIHNLDLVLVEMRGDLYRFVQVSGDTIVLNDKDDPRRSYIFTDMPYKLVACPVHTEGKVDAITVMLNHPDKPDFSNSDRKLLKVLANQLSSISNTYYLLESMRNFNEQLAMSLIEAVEAKDPYTRGHSERVHHLSMEIGKYMKLPKDELEDLHWGSLLHDVGKIGIPDAVLCKPSRLNEDEYTFIMVHPERSYEILRHIKHLDKAVLGARHHQEMYNGKGYPHGLKGEQIPLHGRIIAVADTYDSITSSRAYRAGRSHEIGMQEIERVSGTQLDPVIVEIFKKLVSTEPEWLKRFGIRRDKANA